MICFMSNVLLNLNDYRECLVRKKLQENKVKGFLSFEFLNEMPIMKNYICERLRLQPPFLGVLGQTHMNGWSRIIATQNRSSTNYIFPFRLRVLQWIHHLFNYWNK